MENWYKARREELRKRSNKGFTLMEMLIVVAIIAVLIAIAIPVFTSQLENSREATDAANIRSAYAEVTAAALSNQITGLPDGVTTTGDGTSRTWSKTVNLQQQTNGWGNAALNTQSIGSVALSSVGVTGGGKVTVTTNAAGVLTITAS